MSLTKKDAQQITISTERAGQRIDNFLINFLKDIPKSRIYKMLRKGEVRVNRRRVKAEYRLYAEDMVRIPPLFHQENVDEQPLQPSHDLRNKLLKSIIYEDNRILIVNKPSGIPVHGGSGLNGGLIEIFRILFPEHRFLELVHRLDRETSGCLIIAKTRKALVELHDMLKKGNVNKTYHALVRGHWPTELRIVEAPLLRFHLKSGERMVGVKAEGKASKTFFNPLQSFAFASLVEASPVTGRTHQIRVHARYAKHCIAGDEKYGDKAFNRLMKDYGCKRLFLHAAGLEFRLQDDKKALKFTADLPEDLQKVLENLPK